MWLDLIIAVPLRVTYSIYVSGLDFKVIVPISANFGIQIFFNKTLFNTLASNKALKWRKCFPFLIAQKEPSSVFI